MHKSTNTFWWISRVGSWPTKLWLKVKNDHRCKFSNLSNWKKEAWKKSGLQRDSNPWPLRYRCVALTTELWSHTLGARSIYWVKKELNKLTSLPMCGFIAQLVEQRTGNVEVTGSNPVEALIFFSGLLLSNCLNWKIYCDDHSSLSSTTAVQKWIISYILHKIMTVVVVTGTIFGITKLIIGTVIVCWSSK